MSGIIILTIFVFFIILKFPMGIALGLSSILGLLIFKFVPLIVLGQLAFQCLFNFSFLALPFYILAGLIMTQGNISRQLVNLANSVIGNIRGGLSMVVIIASAFFAALSGSSTATTIAIGSITLPDFLKQGYEKDFALATVASGGVLGPIIPPSIGFILYGISTQTSIAKLFMGGVVPGFLMVILLLVTVYFISIKKGYQKTIEKISFLNILKAIANAKWALLVPVIILGGIYAGVFTPTEAGAIACVYSIIISMFVEKKLSWSQLFSIFREATIMSGVILFLVVTAGMFGRTLVLAKIPQTLAAGILSVTDSPFIGMLLINIFLLFVGCVMEPSCAILLLAPMLLPVAVSFGFDPVHFGIILVLNITIGAITPPVGCCLFAASAMGDMPVERIAKQALPFLFVYLVCLMLIILFPSISLWLPNLLSAR